MNKLPILALSSFLLVSSMSSHAEPTKVDTFYPVAAQNQQILIFTGTVEAKQNAALAPLQSGVVSALFVEEGDKVKKGQKLMALDAKLAELSLSQSIAQVAAEKTAKVEAERLYKEVVSLSKKQLVAETLMSERLSSWEVAKANLERAKAELAHQKEVVARHTLYAPFPGVIAQRNLDLGEWVTQQTQAFTLVEEDNLRLSIDIPQEHYATLAGTNDVAVTVTPDFSQSQPLVAKISKLVAVANNSSRTFRALVDLPEQSLLVAGMSARAEVSVPNSQQDMLWLPKSAIKQHPDGGRSVFTVVDNKANRVLVEVIKQQGDKVAVVGAPIDAAYVISGVELLKQGDELSVNLVQGDAL